MSNSAYDLVLARKVGATTQKAVLLYMAGRASDNGSGVWASKRRMMRELELTKNPILKALSELISKGLISEVGKRPCSIGYTIVYQLNLKSIAALEPVNPQTKNKPMQIEFSHPQGVHDVNPIHTNENTQEVHDVNPTSAPDEPQEVHDVNPNLPLTIQEPSAADAAFAVDLEFEEFLGAHPKPYDHNQSRKLFDEAIRGGVKSAELIAAAKLYADQQSGQDYKRIAGSTSWLKRKLYEDALRSVQLVKTADPANAEKIDAGWVKAIKIGNQSLARWCPREKAHGYIAQALVTEDQCRDVGISL